MSGITTKTKCGCGKKLDNHNIIELLYCLMEHIGGLATLRAERDALAACVKEVRAAKKTEKGQTHWYPAEVIDAALTRLDEARAGKRSFVFENHYQDIGQPKDEPFTRGGTGKARKDDANG